MECSDRDVLLHRYADITDEMYEAVSALHSTNPANFNGQLDRCREVGRRAAHARIALEDHRRQHGC